jgi:hypothetical protein
MWIVRPSFASAFWHCARFVRHTKRLDSVPKASRDQRVGDGIDRENPLDRVDRDDGAQRGQRLEHRHRRSVDLVQQEQVDRQGVGKLLLQMRKERSASRARGADDEDVDALLHAFFDFCELALE